MHKHCVPKAKIPTYVNIHTYIVPKFGLFLLRYFIQYETGLGAGMGVFGLLSLAFGLTLCIKKFNG